MQLTTILPLTLASLALANPNMGPPPGYLSSLASQALPALVTPALQQASSYAAAPSRGPALPSSNMQGAAPYPVPGGNGTGAAAPSGSGVPSGAAGPRPTTTVVGGSGGNGGSSGSATTTTGSQGAAAALPTGMGNAGLGAAVGVVVAGLML